MNKLTSEITWGSTKHCAQMGCPECGSFEYLESSAFDQYIDAEFESKFFMIAAGYDGILRRRYGEYMRLPPAEEQQPKHDHTKYYYLNHNKHQ